MNNFPSPPHVIAVYPPVTASNCLNVANYEPIFFKKFRSQLVVTPSKKDLKKIIAYFYKNRK